MMEYAKMIDLIPESRSGDVQIRHIEVGKQDSEMTKLRALINNRPREYIPAGRYAQLIVGGELMMSDTPSEQRENLELIQMAYGRVLIAGLGLGMVLVPLLANPNVGDITVVELSWHVIKLVGRHFDDPRLRIVQGNINSWKAPRGARWETIYLDIWPSISVDDVPEIKKLKRRFRRRLAPGGWLGAWAEPERRASRRREVAMVRSRGYAAADIPPGENVGACLMAAHARKLTGGEHA
jgi:hypothetical protein